MKRNIKILILAIILLILTALSAYAITIIPNEKIVEKKVSTEAINVSSNILSKLNSTDSIINTQVKYDMLKDTDVYQVSNSKYMVNLDANQNLIGIYSKSISPVASRSVASKEEAREVIMNKYKELNLPAEYDLVYLEKIDEEIWEADFQKNYNGIYNKYEAVKTFFIPENNEIVALTVFNEGHGTSEISVSAEEAIKTVSEELDIDSSKIISSELTMEKSNKTFDNKNKDKSVHTAWVLETSDKSFIYVDATENNIIGGDVINE